MAQDSTIYAKSHFENNNKNKELPTPNSLSIYQIKINFLKTIRRVMIAGEQISQVTAPSHFAPLEHQSTLSPLRYRLKRTVRPPPTKVAEAACFLSRYLSRRSCSLQN